MDRKTNTLQCGSISFPDFDRDHTRLQENDQFDNSQVLFFGIKDDIMPAN